MAGMEPPRYNAEVADAIARDGFYVRWRQSMPGTTRHHQPGLELDLLLRGPARLELGDQALELQSGEAAVFDAGQPHALLAPPGQRFRRTTLCLALPLREAWSGLVPAARPLRRWRLSPAAVERLDHLAGQVYEEQTLRGRGWQAMAEGLLAQWLVIFRREIEASRYDAGAAGQLVRAARDYVADHLDDALTLDAVAGRFGVSGEHLTRRFRAELGVPFHQYVLRRRIAEAKRLLHEAPDLSVTAVGLRAGFGSSSSFSRAFRRATGLSPSAFRDQPSSSPPPGRDRSSQANPADQLRSNPGRAAR